MRVLHLSDFFSNSIGSVILPRISREMQPWDVESGLAFRREASWLRFQPLLRRTRPQLLHYHFTGTDYYFLGMKGVLSGLPLVVSLQGLNRDIAASRIKRNYLRWLLGRAAAVTACSDSTAREGMEICGGVGIRTIYNGASREPVSASFRHPSSPSRPYVISVSTLHPVKGLDLAALAFRDAVQAGHDVDWVVCGPDSQFGHLQSWIKLLGIEDRVHILGHLPFREVSELISRSLLLIHSARYEPFGMAVIEAMALGKPVLATAVGGIPEYVRDGQNGILVRWGDAEGLKGSLLKLLSDENLRAALGREAEKTAARFSWEAAARDYVRLYRSLVDPHTQTPGPAARRKEIKNGTKKKETLLTP